jgi:hypothetical protein
MYQKEETVRLFGTAQCIPVQYHAELCSIHLLLLGSYLCTDMNTGTLVSVSV